MQGNWFYEDATFFDPDSWTKQLTFGYENTDPDIAVISIGGEFTRYGTFSFLPKSKGLINRKFDEANLVNTIYCFEAADNVKSESPRTDGKILVQLVSETKIEIEHQNGSCGGSEEFAIPTTYER